MRTIFIIGFILGAITIFLLDYQFDCTIEISHTWDTPNASRNVYGLRCKS